MTELPFSATTPVSVARVGLRARNADQLASYYKRLLGLRETRRQDNVIGLGTDSRELIEIEGSSSLRADDPASAGLFHTAFLLPTRADLARWTQFASAGGIPIDGASDHLVSEAVYLTDPEGNGIEIYADRPKEAWPRPGGTIQMATERLDFGSLMGEIAGEDDQWSAAPDGTVIGHVHLRVGDVAAAEAWWNGEMGLDTMVHYGNAAVFLASGGYHHHIGANVWHSRGAGQRERDRAGLSYVELESTAGARAPTQDPWGTEVRTVAKAA